MIKKAFLWESGEDKKVECNLCSHHCIIKPGKCGFCLVRENRDGVLYSLVYGKVIAKHVDPVEKKPLYHFMPGSNAYSIATVGCNFRCSFCQNADISQLVRDSNIITGEETEPFVIVEDALAAQCKSIAYTYTEPTVYCEFAYDVAELAKEKGIKNIFVTNGYMTRETLKHISSCLDGANIDLKAFSERFYRDLCGARLKPVLETITAMKELGIWVEVTTLLIPNENDSTKELNETASFIASLDKDIPWHISRYHPDYKYDKAGLTPSESIRKARDIGFENGLKYVYTGNLPGDDGENTFCPRCAGILIERRGYSIVNNITRFGTCPGCGIKIAGIGMG